MKKTYSTLMIPENQDALMLSICVDDIIYNIWYNEIFVLIKEFKVDAEKSIIENLTKEEVKNLLYNKLKFTGSWRDNRALFFDWVLWSQLGFIR